ncbi:MAG: hypothetical protein V4582_21810 [Pseudomonadota bacterium]
MRAILLTLCALLCAPALAAAPAAPATAPDASYGEHGMALFGGKDGLYASHLPMRHAPHDYQVVLQVHLASPAQDTALRARIDDKLALWTIAPEKFELDRLAPAHTGTPRALKRFKADIVLGHFEQGGKTEYAGATVVVDKVLLFRQLSAQAVPAASARYLPVGRFLVKQIDSRPDFDHIVAMAAQVKAPITLDKHDVAETNAAALAKAAGVPVRGTVYYTSDDLN